MTNSLYDFEILDYKTLHMQLYSRLCKASLVWKGYLFPLNALQLKKMPYLEENSR